MEGTKWQRLAGINRSLANLEEKLDGIQYELMDLMDPKEYWSAGESIDIARGALEDLRGQITVLQRLRK